MTDRELQRHVQNALEWEPSIDSADIGVSVEGNVVTLRGDVKTYSEKMAAERIAVGVFGVKAVANDINVRPTGLQRRTDSELAQAVLSALKWNTLVPEDKITVTVDDGFVTLQGKADWEYERTAATKAVCDLAGVRGVANAIVLEPHVSVTDVKSKIEAALKRSAEVDARRINVAVADGKVTLTGNVHSWTERNQARHAAWAAPGVKEVEDLIAVVP